MPVTLLYLTAPDLDAAKSAARMLLAERLIACANILGPMAALYRWEGEIREATEVAWIAKTTDARAQAAIARARALHPYACPCIVALPVAAGYGPFLEWVANEVAEAPGEPGAQ